MTVKVQFLAIWSIVMLLIPAGAIYLIDNYETGVVRDAIETQSLSLFSRGYAHSLPAGDMVSAGDKTDFESMWSATVNVDDTFWDTVIDASYPLFPSTRGRNGVSIVGNNNVAIINWTGFNPNTPPPFPTSIVHWTSLTAYTLAEYDAVAINTTIIYNIPDWSEVYLGVANGGGGYWIDISGSIEIDNQTIVMPISQTTKTDLLALAVDGRVWLVFDNVDSQVPIYEWSIELLTFETEFSIDPMTAWGVTLLLMIVTSFFMLLISTDWVDFESVKHATMRKKRR